MKSNGALQVIFAFFLGLVVVGFVAIGVATFYPEPSYQNYDSQQAATWRLVTGIILLVVATAILAISLALPHGQAVISNGVLLGGVFTMVYAVGMTVSAEQSLWRFAVAAVALAVTIGIGYAKFVRRPRGLPAASTAGDLPPDVAVRLEHVEHRLDALRRALDD